MLPTLVKGWVRGALRRAGYDLVRSPRLSERETLRRRYRDFDDGQIDTVLAVRKYTMTSPERIVALTEAIRYLHRNLIGGDVVECGVWRGGSMMAAARTLSELGDLARDLFLFDTFEGMSPPTDLDVAHDGRSAARELAAKGREDPGSWWCYAPLDGVKQAMAQVDYPSQRVHFVQGKVEDTLPGSAPEKIALLRLDTDWYESTRHELEHLYPRLVQGGILIIDDYGHWRGSRKATDEYLERMNVKAMLFRTDYTGRMLVKP